MKLGRFATGAGGVERLDNPPQNSLEQAFASYGSLENTTSVELARIVFFPDSRIFGNHWLWMLLLQASPDVELKGRPVEGIVETAAAKKS
jgi:hypothetical protein